MKVLHKNILQNYCMQDFRIKNLLHPIELCKPKFQVEKLREKEGTVDTQFYLCKCNLN